VNVRIINRVDCGIVVFVVTFVCSWVEYIVHRGLDTTLGSVWIRSPRFVVVL